MRRGTVVGLLAVTAVVAVGVIGVVRFRTVHPTPGELEGLPGVGTYPGAEIYKHARSDGERNVMATNPAVVRIVGCAGTDAAELRAWHGDELGRAGWSADPTGDPAPDPGWQSDAAAWRRGSRLVVLRLLRPSVTDSYARSSGRPEGCVGGFELLVQ